MSVWDSLAEWNAQLRARIQEAANSTTTNPQKTGRVTGLLGSIDTLPPPPGGNLFIRGDGGGGSMVTGFGSGGGDDVGGYDPYAAATAAANAAARQASERQNENTRAAADAKYGLISGFDKALKSKLGNITSSLTASDTNLLTGYRENLLGLEGTRTDNEKSESDASFANISNTLRERSEILSEVASQGAGETDLLRAQLSALRNYDANQSDINRSYFDTLRSVNRAVTGLNVDTATSRKNLYDKAEDDREGAYSNYYNQLADTWNEIFNIENSNTNVDSDSSVAYTKKYGNAATNTAKYVGTAYTKKAFDENLRNWEGQGTERTRTLSSNRAQVINLGGAQKRPEGATLRKW